MKSSITVYIIISMLMKLMILYIYRFWSKMEPISPTNCFNFDIKWLHIFIIATLSIDAIRFAITNLPGSFSKFITPLVLLVVIDFFSWQKNNSTGANSGAYWGKNIQDTCFSFIKSRNLFWAMYRSIIQNNT